MCGSYSASVGMCVCVCVVPLKLPCAPLYLYFYPIDSQGVRHMGIFILLNANCPGQVNRGGRSKVVGQSHRVTVNLVGGVFYAIDSWEVRHVGIFS